MNICFICREHLFSNKQRVYFVNKKTTTCVAGNSSPDQLLHFKQTLSYRKDRNKHRFSLQQ